MGKVMVGVAALPTISGPHDGPENFSPLERCLSRGALGSMLPVGNTNGNQIIQAPGLVAILNEMIHETRVIPVDGRPHLGANVRSYMGDSRGRWEGQTLVVETINFNETSNYIVGGPGTRIPSYSRDARLTERFTRIDADTIRYEASILFILDRARELDAVQAAGLQTLLCVRPAAVPPLRLSTPARQPRWGPRF